MKKIKFIVISFLLTLCLISCNKSDNSNEEVIEKDKKYVLVENVINGENNPILEGEYLYLTFKEDGILVNEQKKHGEEPKILTQEYIKKDDYYLVVIDNFAYKYFIKDDGETLELEYNFIITVKQIYKLVK